MSGAQDSVTWLLMTVDDGLWRVYLQSWNTGILGRQAVAVLVLVCVAFLWAAVVDGGRRAGWLVAGQDGPTGFVTVMVEMIMEVRGSQLIHCTAILHHGSSRHTFKKITKYKWVELIHFY